MNKEIKEILKYLKNDFYVYGEVYIEEKCKAITKMENQQLLDYITNLQEQLHQASLDIQELTERDIWCPSNCDKLINLQQKYDEANNAINWWSNKAKELQEENEHLRTQLNTYENPDDMTLFYMWLDEKAKDKMKALQKENDYYFKKNNEISTLNTSLRSDRDNYKSRIDKARHKLNIMFSNGNEDIILDDLLELDKILGEDNE